MKSTLRQIIVFTPVVLAGCIALSFNTSYWQIFLTIILLIFGLDFMLKNEKR